MTIQSNTALISDSERKGKDTQFTITLIANQDAVDCCTVGALGKGAWLRKPVGAKFSLRPTCLAVALASRLHSPGKRCLFLLPGSSSADRKAVYKLEVVFLVELEKEWKGIWPKTAVSNLCCVKFTVCIFHVPLDSVDVIISAFSFLFF